MTLFFTLCVMTGLLSCSACAVNPASEAESLADFYYQTPTELTSLEETMNINGFLPEQIYIKTLTQTFCRDYQFCLVDGLIYYKSMPDAKYFNSGKNEKIWQLLNGTGLPFAVNGKDFSEPESIVEIAADADSLFAFDSKGGMYQMFTNDLGPGKPFQWLVAFGWPQKTQLVQNQLIAGKRAWASGARRQDVLWHEDIFGNPHHYGTMGIETLYFLSENGQSIRFTDSGLPADFSRSILGPERGAFVAENLSASASTMFVINKAGVMYTRLADFDTLGCDPMFFRYTYEKLPQKYTGEQYLSNYSPWGLPSEPWLLQPEIPLQGKARLSKFITILQNGHGNAARELRVAGLDSNGQTGYYSKQIMELKPEDWIFVPVQLDLKEEMLLPVTAEGIPEEVKKTLSGKKQEYSYSGSLWQDGQRNPEIICNIPDFPMSEGQCTLYLTYKDETKQITLHPVEIWSYMFRNNPGLDGTAKNLFITFEYEPNVFDSKYPEFTEVLKKLLENKNKLLFSSMASVTDRYFRLTSTHLEKLTGKKNIENYIAKTSFTILLNNTQLSDSTEETIAKSLFYYEAPSLMQYNSSTLKLQPGTEFTVSERIRLDQAVRSNLAYYEMLQKELEIYKNYAKKAQLSRWGYSVADLFTTITLLNQVNFPKIKNITSFGNQIMTANDKTYQTQADVNSWIYSHLMELLKVRINAYQQMQNSLLKQPVVTVPEKLRDSFAEYYINQGGIPLQISGITSLENESKANLYLLPDVPSFPGFCITLEENDSIILLVELDDSAQTLYDMVNEISLENPLKLDARFYYFSSIGFIPEEFEKTSLKGNFYWDGQQLTITTGTGLFQEKIVFTGTKK